MDSYEFSSPPSMIFDDVSLDDIGVKDDIKEDTSEIKSDYEEEELSVRVEINQDIKGYWEIESGLTTKPTWTYLSLAVQHEPMEILTRSRNGDNMVCSSKDAMFVMKRTEKWWSFIGGKISFIANENGDMNVLNPNFVKNILVTDVNTCAFFSRISNNEMLKIDPNTVLVELDFAGVLRVAEIQLTNDTNRLLWISEEETEIYSHIIRAHNEQRVQDIQRYFFDISLLVESNRDFINVYDGTPSITSQVKSQGRAPYSIDKGPRAVRSATLKSEDEVLCIGVAMVVLYISNKDSVYEKWSLNRVANEIFRNTKAYALLCKSRGNNNMAVTNQLRRWLPFCRELAKKSRFFSTEQCPIFASTPQSTDLRIKWMNKRAPAVFEFVKRWITGGEKTDEIIDEVESVPIKDWYVERLKTINEMDSPMTISSFGTVQDMMISPMDDEAEVTMNASINVIDLVRVQNLTVMSENGMDEAQKKKTQRMFQTLAQNVVSHKRNFKGLVETMERVSSILMRMQTLEKNIHKNMSDIGGDDIPNIVDMKRLVYENIQEVEEGAKNDIRDSLEPLVPFLLRRKTDAEIDDFIGHFLAYSEAKP